MALVRFGTFELDGDARELRRHGRLVHLTGQPLKALELLVSRPGEIVSRDELRRHIWGDSRFVDFDRGLNFCIATIRTALADSARSPRFIETIPRRGYRFIGEVRITETPTLPSGPPTSHLRQGYGGQADFRHPTSHLRQGYGGQADLRPPTSVLRRRWAIAAVLPLLLMQGPSATRAHTRVTTTRDALSAFERGMADLADGVDGRRRSIYRFREATRLDPRFAEAHYALADVYLDLAAARVLSPTAALAQARDEALRALALEDIADTRIVLGIVRLVHDWDWSGAGRELVRSLEAEPNSDGALVAYARYLSAAGDAPAAIATIDRAEAISPSCDLLLWESALIRYRAGRGDEALEKVRLAAEYGPPRGMDADQWESRTKWLALLIHAQQRRWPLAAEDADAIAALSEERPAIDRSGRDPRASVLAFVRASADRASRQTAASLRPMWIATLYAIAGDDEAALTWLERAARERDTEVLFGLRNPAFDDLRQRERFRRLLATRPAAAPTTPTPAPASAGPASDSL